MSDKHQTSGAGDRAIPDSGFRVLLGLSAALVLVMLVSRWLPAAMQPTARLHPDAISVLQSTGGLAERPEAIWLGYGMGLLILALMATCVWIGLRKQDAGTPLSRLIMIGFVAYAVVFTAMTITYAAYTRSPSEAAFFGGFPPPTAWMLYGMWHFPLLLVVLYMVRFDRWVLTEQDLQRFRKLVEENRRQGGTT